MNKDFFPGLVIISICCLLVYFKLIKTSQMFLIFLIYIFLSLSNNPREAFLRWINTNQTITAGILSIILILDFIL